MCRDYKVNVNNPTGASVVIGDIVTKIRGFPDGCWEVVDSNGDKWDIYPANLTKVI